MAFYDFMHKINLRLITVHLIATFFIILAARQFAMLNDTGIVESVDKYGLDEGLKHLVKEDNFSTRLAYFSLWINLSSLIGLLLAFIASLILTIKKKMFWLNALIVFIMAILLNRLGLYENKIIGTIFFSLGDLTSHFGLQYKFITNGTILTLAGLFMFLSKWTNNLALKHQTPPRFVSSQTE